MTFCSTEKCIHKLKYLSFEIEKNVAKCWLSCLSLKNPAGWHSVAGAVAAVAGAGGGVALAAAAREQAGLPWWDCSKSNSCRRGKWVDRLLFLLSGSKQSWEIISLFSQNQNSIFSPSNLILCVQTRIRFHDQGLTPPPALRIKDVYPGSRTRIIPSRISDPRSKRHQIQDQQHRIWVPFLPQKIALGKTSEIFIPNPYFFHLRPGGPESTGSRIPIRIRNTALHTESFLLITVYHTKMFLLLRSRFETWPGQAWWWWFSGDWAVASQDFSPPEKCGSRSLSSARGPTLNRNKSRN